MNKDHINEVIELIKTAYLVEFIDGVIKVHVSHSTLTFGLEKHFEISELDAFKMCWPPRPINYKTYSLNNIVKYLEVYRDTGEINFKIAAGEV